MVDVILRQELVDSESLQNFPAYCRSRESSIVDGQYLSVANFLFRNSPSRGLSRVRGHCDGIVHHDQ